MLCLAACSGRSEVPELTARRRALTAWETGRTALDAGDASAARLAFTEALDHRPSDPLLLAWRAQAEAGEGDLEHAIATLEVVLSREPKMAEARYNLACYQARSGLLDEAGESLQRALADGAGDPRDVLEDPDFQPHLAHAALAFLPKAALDVAVTGPQGSVFVGSEATVRLSVQARRLGRMELSAPEVEGPVSLAKVDERIETVDGGDRRHTVSWSLRVDGAGQAEVGPFEVRVDRRVAAAKGFTLDALAPPGHTPPAAATVRLEVPSEVARRDSDGIPTAPAVWRSGQRLAVWTGPHDRIEPAGTDEPGVRWRHFEGRDLRWVLHTWTAPALPTRVRVVRGGDVVLDEAVER